MNRDWVPVVRVFEYLVVHVFASPWQDVDGVDVDPASLVAEIEHCSAHQLYLEKMNSAAGKRLKGR
jgi:hypothetical protein